MSIEMEIIELTNKGFGRGLISKKLGIPQCRVYSIRKKLGYFGKPGLKKGVEQTEKQRQSQIENGKKQITHGLWYSKIYKIYYALTQRCNNPKVMGYKNYGGRGIKNLWKSFIEFHNDMKEIYNQSISDIGEKDISIERVNVNGNYCKENCIFIHKKLQASNQQRHYTEQHKGRLNYCEVNNIHKRNKLEYHKYWSRYIRCSVKI